MSDATTKAEPTEGWPASSTVCTNQTEGSVCLIRVCRMSPPAWRRWRGTSSLWMSALALSLSEWMVPMALSKFCLKRASKAATRWSTRLSRYS